MVRNNLLVVCFKHRIARRHIEDSKNFLHVCWLVYFDSLLWAVVDDGNAHIYSFVYGAGQMRRLRCGDTGGVGWEVEVE